MYEENRFWVGIDSGTGYQIVFFIRNKYERKYDCGSEIFPARQWFQLCWLVGKDNTQF